MPRTAKPAGTTVDRRNGRRTEIGAAEQLTKFSLPRRADGKPWSLETRKAWAAMWKDPVSSLLSVADRIVLLRWASALHRAERAYELADAEPTVKGSMGQLVPNPLYAVGDAQVAIAQKCEAQIGVGARGAHWHRKFDRAGFVFISNAISRDHQEYLALGGEGFLLGDGRLNYGRENIIETYYTLHAWRGIFPSFGLQHINNPGYNRDRGPVIVPTLRLHVEL